jgi:O-antigen ligase
MLRQTPFIALLCLALLANFMLVTGHDQQRLVEMGVVLLAGGLVVVAHRARVADPFSGRAGNALAAFFILGILGSLSAFSPRHAFFEVANLFLLYLLALTVAAEIARNGQPAIPRVLHCLAVMCAFYAFLFIVAYVGGLSLGIPLALDDFTTNFSNIRFFNHVQTSTLPLLVLLCCLTPRGSRFRWLWLAVTAYWWMALFATNGRGTLLGTAVGCIAVAVLVRRRAAPFLRQVALTAALGLLAYFLFLTVVPVLLGTEGMRSFAYTLHRTAVDPSSQRAPLWHLAAGLVAQHPWLGVGPMQFARVTTPLHMGSHPHDWLLQIAAEWGLPALACLLAAIAFGVRALFQAAAHVRPGDAANHATFAALLMGAVAILVDGLVSGILVMPQSQLAIALYLGCAIGWQRTVVPVVRTPPAGVRRGAAAVCVAVALSGVITGAWPEAGARLRGEELTPAEQTLNTGLYWPRLWKAGHF